MYRPSNLLYAHGKLYFVPCHVSERRRMNLHRPFDFRDACACITDHVDPLRGRKVRPADEHPGGGISRNIQSQQQSARDEPVTKMIFYQDAPGCDAQTFPKHLIRFGAVMEHVRSRDDLERFVLKR